MQKTSRLNLYNFFQKYFSLLKCIVVHYIINKSSFLILNEFNAYIHKSTLFYVETKILSVL